jgi:hypothetical protein
MTTLLRSHVELGKRVFLDRLTTDAQPLAQPADLDSGPGEAYEYAGVYDAGNFGVGADCSGSAGVFLGIACNGPEYFAGGYRRLFSTETFPGPLEGFRQVSQADLLANAYPLKVCIMHGGGGPNSHMNCSVDGWLMESNGDHGTCTEGHGAIPQSSNYWNDFWVHDGPIVEDTTSRQSMGYPRGLDYAGGRISGASLRNAGIAFVCRYLTDGGSSLPGKQLLPDEAADLRNNGVGVVSNWETTADRMLGGYNAGHDDATAARDWVVHCGGPADGVIYFSADWDATPEQQAAINDYLHGCADVLGGPDHVGIYGGYWPLSRALDAGACRYAWQTEAWSGGNIDARVNIVQRNGLGYSHVDGVECDIDEAHSVNFGQWGAAVAPGPPATPPPPPAQPTEVPTMADIVSLAEQVRAKQDGVAAGDMPDGTKKGQPLGYLRVAQDRPRVPGDEPEQQYSTPSQGDHLTHVTKQLTGRLWLDATTSIGLWDMLALYVLNLVEVKGLPYVKQLIASAPQPPADAEARRQASDAAGAAISWDTD